MKPFKSFDEQLHILQEHKLIIDSPEKTTYYLKLYGYYPLINGYKDAFQVKTQGERIYRPGTKFDEIVYLYSFDYTLRNLLLESLFIIEKRLKSIISYVFSSTYGESHLTYLTPKCFNTNNPQNESRVFLLIKKMNNTLAENDDKNVIKHYLTVHQTVPLWVLFTVSTFGQVSKFFANLKDKEQQRISAEFSLNPKELKSMLYFLNKIRNICAHGERLYSFKKDRKRESTLPKLKIHEKLLLPMSNNTYQTGTDDIFAILICFKYLLPSNLFGVSITEVQRTLSKMSTNINSESAEYVINVSGLKEIYLSRLQQYSI